MPNAAAILAERQSGRHYSGNARFDIAAATYSSRTHVQSASSRDRARQDRVEMAPGPGDRRPLSRGRTDQHDRARRAAERHRPCRSNAGKRSPVLLCLSYKRAENDESPAGARLPEIPLRGFEPRFPP